MQEWIVYHGNRYVGDVYAVTLKSAINAAHTTYPPKKGQRITVLRKWDITMPHEYEELGPCA